MNLTYFYAVSALFNGLFGLFLVYYLYLRNRKSSLNRSFLFFGISVTGWSLIYSFWGFTADATLAEFSVRCHMMFEALIPATFLHFALQFTQQYEKYKKLLKGAYLLGFAYSLLMMTPLMIEGVKKILHFQYWPQAGILLPSHVVYFGGVVLFGLGLLIQRIFKTSGNEQRQAGWVLAAFIIGFGGGSINWLLWFDIPIAPTTNFFVGGMFVIMAYAMVRYGLMDVDSVVEMLRASRAATLGLWAASLNHELRNPLYIAREKIEIHLEAVREKRWTPEREIEKSREVLEASAKQLQRGMEVMRRFAHFLKPSSEGPKNESIQLEEIVEQVLSFAGEELILQRIQVNQKLKEKLTLFGDRRQFEEIFFNLIVNASHAMKEKGGELSIEAHTDREKTVVQISDTGIGIPFENQRRIFEPFVTTREDRGSGLGLYIAKQLTERNSGKISVKSQLGQGTTFTLEFKS